MKVTYLNTKLKTRQQIPDKLALLDLNSPKSIPRYKFIFFSTKYSCNTTSTTINITLWKIAMEARHNFQQEPSECK